MDAAQTLKSHQLRVTKIRLAILDALSQREAAQPYSALQQSLGEFDRTTLYRTLLALIEKGLIHKALEENGEIYYALCATCTTHEHRHDHVHFRCTTCGEVTCVHLSEDLKIALPDLHIQELDITAKGTCERCLN